MFAFLRGAVAHKAADHVALDVNGAGYLVHVPDSVNRRVALHQEVRLFTYCYIREDAFQIFGFLTEEEKRIFTTLLGINGVGPKAALAILSVLPPERFGRAVLDNAVDAFTKAPGVGKKIAQRIVVELKSKMGQDVELSAILGEPEGAAQALDADGGDDAYEALIALGCTPLEARKAAGAARESLGADAALEDVVRKALQSLARR